MWEHSTRTHGRLQVPLLHAAQANRRRKRAEGDEGRHGGRLQQERRAPAQGPRHHAAEDVALTWASNMPPGISKLTGRKDCEPAVALPGSGMPPPLIRHQRRHTASLMLLASMDACRNQKQSADSRMVLLQSRCCTTLSQRCAVIGRGLRVQYTMAQNFLTRA